MSSPFSPKRPLASGDQAKEKVGAHRRLAPLSGVRERFKTFPLPYRLIFVVMSSLIILTSTIGGVAYGVYAANQPVKLPIKEAKTTVKQFLEQTASAKGNKGTQVVPKGSQALPYWKNEPGEPKSLQPSAAPATMKPATVTIPTSAFANEAAPELTPTPEVTPTPQATPTQEATSTPAVTATPTATVTSTPAVTATPTAAVTPEATEEPATDQTESQSAASSLLPLTTLSTAPSTEEEVPESADPITLVGSDEDGVLIELIIPAGALDLSQATTESGAAPQGGLSLSLSQIHGHFIAESKLLGYFQLGITDSTGATVKGLKLLTPAKFVYHYKDNELIDLDMDNEGLLLTYPSLIEQAEAAGEATAPYVLTLTNDAEAQTLTAETTVLEAVEVAAAGDTADDQPPVAPRMATVSGNSGSLSYSYPITVPPGPPGITPDLQLIYSSGNTNQRHSPLSPAGWAGEGWSLSLGSITAEDQTVSGTTKKWFFINGVDGVSDRLISNDGEQTFITEHLSYLKIKRIEREGLQPCFNVWDTSGNYYEFGCNADSLQYTLKNGNRYNYRWDLNKFVPAKNGLADDDREMTVTYVQDKINSGDIVRDAAPKEIIYGNGTARAGTVRFFYKGPEAITDGGVTWVEAYGTNYNCSNPPKSTTLRCDNPLDRDSGLLKPRVMSTLTLADIYTYVGTVSTTSQAHHYDFDYSYTPFVTCKESTTLTPAFCAGDFLLTNIDPEVFQNGVARVLPSTVFTYSADLPNTYVDTTHNVDGDPYQVTTNWRYLIKYMDLASGVGATITYQKAYGNTNGTPQAANGDNRYNALFCSTYTTCTGNFARPDGRQWSVQVVASITNSGKDSSASSLAPAKTSYSYWLTHTSDSCATDSAGLDDCVRYTWIPPDDDAWKDYFHSEFRGFAKMLITSPSGDLTVQEYATTQGWETPQTRSNNYTGGSLVKELVYAGGAINPAKLLQQTENFYAGYDIDGVNTPNACNASFTSTVYKPCAVMLLKTKTTRYEQTGASNANAPWVQSTYAYDNYSSTVGLGDYHQAPATNEYGNLLTEVIESSNAPKLTKKWSYYTTDTTVNSVTYYNVRLVAHSELLDASGHVWSCEDTVYDEGVASGIPQPAAGWPTTVKSYSDCANQSATTIKSYSGYDANGNVVASVDGVGAATPSLYNSAGCTLSAAPKIFPTASWSAGKYTSCSTYNATGAVETNTWNAFGHQTVTAYDATQGMIPISITDVNNQVTATSYSYASLGNTKVSTKAPGEQGTYTSQTATKSTCTTSSTLPCLSSETNSSLYATAVTRIFYDSQGHKVQTLTPGPGAGQTTVTFTLYNDQANSVFESVSFVVAARSTWLDPNGATDITGITPAGTITVSDALGRVLTVTDPLGNQTKTSYGIGSISGVTGDNAVYGITTTIDANQHVGASYTDELGRTRYTLVYEGIYGGTLTAVKRTSTQYNALDLATAVTVTDLAPQSGQSITEVTTTSQYDDLGWQTVLIDPDRGTHTFTYDANGGVIKDVSGSRTLGWSYDLLGRLGCLQGAAPTPSPQGACTSGANALVENNYDTDPSGSGVPWSSNKAIGKLTQAKATTFYSDGMQASVTENMQYDQRGRLVTKRMQITSTGGISPLPTLPTYQEQMSYNNADQLTTTQTSIGGQPGYTFSPAYDSSTGIVVGLSNTTTGTTNLIVLSYNERALISDVIFKDSAGATLATKHLLYDGNLRPASSTTTWQGGSTIYSDGISFDAIGNVLSRVTTHAAIEGVEGSGGNETQNFCYNALDQLVWASNSSTPNPGTGEHCGTASLQNQLGGSFNTSFVYTHLGQLWQGPLAGAGAQQQYLYCNTSQPHQLTNMALLSGNPTCGLPGTTSYTASYDAFGNMTTRTYNGQIGTMDFDALDRLTQWKTFTSTKFEQYLYNTAGERVLRRSNDGTTTKLVVYAFGLEEHQYQEDSSGNLTNSGNTYYYSVGGMSLGMLSGTSTLSITFLLTDTLNSVVSSFSNTTGTSKVLGNQVYGPYGNQRYQQGSMGTEKGYTGQYTDSLSGLYYYVARYYDPVIGRFISADTVEDNWHGFDPYAYVSGNPITMNDPTGHCGNWCKGFWTTMAVAAVVLVAGAFIIGTGGVGAAIIGGVMVGGGFGALAGGGGTFASYIGEHGKLPPHDTKEEEELYAQASKNAWVQGGIGAATSLVGGVAGVAFGLAEKGSKIIAAVTVLTGVVGTMGSMAGNLAQEAIKKQNPTKGPDSNQAKPTPTPTPGPKSHYNASGGSPSPAANKSGIRYPTSINPSKGGYTSSAGRSYVVRPGDTLWGIASGHYGSGLNWQKIYQANKGAIGNNPNLIYPGQRFVIPR